MNDGSAMRALSASREEIRQPQTRGLLTSVAIGYLLAQVGVPVWVACTVGFLIFSLDLP